MSTDKIKDNIVSEIMQIFTKQIAKQDFESWYNSADEMEIKELMQWAKFLQMPLQSLTE